MKTKVEKKLEKKMKKTLSRDEFKKILETLQLSSPRNDIDLVEFVEKYRKERRKKKIRKFFTSIKNLPRKLLGLPRATLKMCIRIYYRCQNKQKLIQESILDRIYPTPLHRYLGILPNIAGDFKDMVIGEPTTTFYSKPDYSRKYGGKFLLPPDFVKQEGLGEVYIHKKWKKLTNN